MIAVQILSRADGGEEPEVPEEPPPAVVVGGRSRIGTAHAVEDD
jgi:hypothetical protein